MAQSVSPRSPHAGDPEMTHHERLDPPENVDPQFIASEQIDFDDTHQLDMSTVGNNHPIDANADQIDRTAPVMRTDQPGRSSSLPSPQSSGGFAATLLSNAVLFINLAIILTVSLYCLHD